MYLGVTAEESVVLERKKNLYTPEEIRAIRQMQYSLEELKEKVDWLIDNNQTKEKLAESVKNLLRRSSASLPAGEASCPVEEWPLYPFNNALGKGGAYLKDIPREVISIAHQYQSVDALENWLEKLILEITMGAKLSKEALSFLETITFLFGFESKPDKGIFDSKGSFF